MDGNWLKTEKKNEYFSMKSFYNPAYLTESTDLEIWAKVKILLRQLQLNKSLKHHQAQAGNPQPKAKKATG